MAIKLLVDAPTTTAGTVVKHLGLPSNARLAMLTVKATTDGTGIVAAKVVQYAPDQVATTAIDVPGAAVDNVGISSTAVARYLVWGDASTAAAGTSFDTVVAPVSQAQQLSYTITANVTNLKIWVEYWTEPVA